MHTWRLTEERNPTIALCVISVIFHNGIWMHTWRLTQERHPTNLMSVRRGLFGQQILQNTSRLTTNERNPINVMCVILKGFSWLSTLTKHMQIHTRDRPYKCYVCWKQFRQTNNQIHTWGLTQEKDPTMLCGREYPKNCDMCDNLTQHMQTHQIKKL